MSLIVKRPEITMHGIPLSGNRLGPLKLVSSMKLAQNVIAHLTSNPCAESAKFDMFNSTTDATLSHLKMEGYDEYDAIDKLFGVDILKEFVVDTPDGGTITKKFKGKIASWGVWWLSRSCNPSWPPAVLRASDLNARRAPPLLLNTTMW